MSENNSFDLLEIIRVIYKKRKFVIILTLAALLTGIVFCIVSDSKYTSQTIFIVKNPQMLDRNYIFRNTNYEHKDFFAIPDDIDQVEAIAKSNALLWHLINKFELDKVYGIKNPAWLLRVVKWNFVFTRTDTKNIELFYTDKDPKRAEAITREAREYMESKFKEYFMETNTQISNALNLKLNALNDSIASLNVTINHLKDSTGLHGKLQPTRGATINNNASLNINKHTSENLETLQELLLIKDNLANDRSEYIRLINEFSVFQQTDMKVFFVVQDAYEPNEASHPKSILIIIGCLIGGFLFASFLAVFTAFYKNKIKQSL